MSRPRGWLGDWRPQRKTLLLIEQIQVVLQEYAAHLPLTVRQIFYRLVGAYGYDKTELAYDRLGEVAAKARRASLIPMDHIRDDGITRLGGHGWASKGALFDNWRQQARHFRLDRQAGQPTQLYLWCEAAGMAPQLERVADPYDVTVLSGGGFDSLTMKHDLAAEFSREGEVMVLHIGDHDPSGVHMFSSLGEDIQAFAASYGGAVRFFRLAVTPAQIAAYGLPTAPPKTTDRRSFDGLTTQAESLPPDVLAHIVEEAIVARVDHEQREVVMTNEVTIRAELQADLDKLMLQPGGLS